MQGKVQRHQSERKRGTTTNRKYLKILGGIMSFDPKQHWEKVYQEKEPGQVSWFQPEPRISLDLIQSLGLQLTDKIIDVGGGASLLVDNLLDKGFNNITVLDISAKALERSKERLGDRAPKVTWVSADITQTELPECALWHDRAVFHFLTDPEDRKRYIQALGKAVRPGGYVIIATFALEGPPKCSGLNVERYDPQKLSQELGQKFSLVKTTEETHVTPWSSEQKFVYCVFHKQMN